MATTFSTGASLCLQLQITWESPQLCVTHNRVVDVCVCVCAYSCPQLSLCVVIAMILSMCVCVCVNTRMQGNEAIYKRGGVLDQLRVPFLRVSWRVVVLS